jgi:hypothetical protein
MMRRAIFFNFPRDNSVTSVQDTLAAAGGRHGHTTEGNALNFHGPPHRYPSSARRKSTDHGRS